MSVLNKNLSICSGFSGMLLLFGLSGLLILTVMGSLQFMDFLRVASFIWLVAWLLGSQNFYFETMNSESFFIQIYSLLLIASVYLIIWVGFLGLSYTESLFITLCIYGAGIVFLVGIIFGNHTGLRSRLADDLFFFIWIFAIFIFVKSVLSPKEIASVTISGVTLNFFQNLILPGQGLVQGIFTTFRNSSLIEYYVYSVILLWRVFVITEDLPQERRIIPLKAFWGSLNLLVGIVIGLAVLQIIDAILYNISIITLFTNFIIALIGMLFLLLVQRPTNSSVI